MISEDARANFMSSKLNRTSLSHSRMADRFALTIIGSLLLVLASACFAFLQKVLCDFHSPC
jgi:hypothetical protein